jgi:RNA polymerase sigma-70 factor (ECF subfamily)
MKPTREHRFEKLLATSLRRLSAIARCYARCEEGKDLLQEILLQIWRSLEGFEGRSTLDTWAYRVALNTAIVWRRKDRARSADAHRPVEVDDLATTANSRDELVILDEFMRSLGPAERALFVFYLEDLSYRQIAEVTGLTESHVGVKLHRLKKTFIERYVK